MQYLGNHEMVPSMKQAQEMKKCSKEHILTYSEIDSICCQSKTGKITGEAAGKETPDAFSRRVIPKSR